jgi:hypothetical protein
MLIVGLVISSYTMTGFHRPSLIHYYRFICHLTPTLNLEFPLEFKPLTYK